MMDQLSINSRGGGAQILLLLHATETGITAGLVFNFKQMKGLLSKETIWCHINGDKALTRGHHPKC